MSAMASGKSVPGPGTKIPSVLQVNASPAPGSEPHIQRRESRGISTQRIELVVITDTEPESSEDDKN
jgi:hypothetical protein